ncbi:unnamed protein product [Leptidea sinapis]|uniref:Uncharacterized protein n=1 Tax=Leptidea sinapis TaxID=189913 RepID=A0A5E4QNS9_9NEOP|nr:unnamed protein product [Leptidea sinapis]
MNATDNIIKDSNRRISEVLYIRKDASAHPAYEVGYLQYVIKEKYRRMIDKYNTSSYMIRRLYTLEVLTYLEEIEHHYWEISHIFGMMHEIERKYGENSSLYEPYVASTTESDEGAISGVGGSVGVGGGGGGGSGNSTKKKKKKQPNLMKNKKEYQNLMNFVVGTTPKQSTRWWWPIEYGWEIDYYW